MNGTSNEIQQRRTHSHSPEEDEEWKEKTFFSKEMNRMDTYFSSPYEFIKCDIFSRGLASSFHSLPLALSLCLLLQPVQICMSLKSYTIWLSIHLEWNGTSALWMHVKTIQSTQFYASHILAKNISQLKQFGTNQNDHGLNANHRRGWKTSASDRTSSTPLKKYETRSLAIYSLPKPAIDPMHSRHWRQIDFVFHLIVSIWPAAAAFCSIRFGRVNK